MRFTPKFLLSAMSPDHFPNESRTGGAPEVAFLGRSNVGKSSLINKLLGSKEAKDAVENNLREGQSLNVNSTPTAFINGRPVAGGDKPTLVQYLTYESSATTTKPQK